MAKLVIREEGWERVENEVTGADRIVSAAIAYVELRFAATFDAAEMLWQQVTSIPLDDDLLRTAGQLAPQQRLRAYDAVHLASLLATGGPPDIQLVSWDRDLNRAAARCGYQVIHG